MRSMLEYFMTWRAVISMLFVRVLLAGMQLLSRYVLVNGTFVLALLLYRHVFATLCMAPLALYFERGHTITFSWSAWFWVFINGVIGLTNQGVFYYGLADTSATYSATFLNLVPVVTFLVSIIFRMEKLGLRNWAGKTKIIGIIVCVGGALMTSLYEGHKFYIGSHHSTHHNVSPKLHKPHMLRGTLFLVACCFSYAGWYIVQVKLFKALPLKLWAITMQCLMITILAAIVGPCIDSRKASWSLEWNMELLTMVYSGVFGSAVTYYLVSWIATMKGPTYPPMFSPLSLIIVAFVEAAFLGEPLTVGILVGMVLVIVGLYCFLWGKSKETHKLTPPNEVTVLVDSTPIEVGSGSSSNMTVTNQSQSQKK